MLLHGTPCGRCGYSCSTVNGVCVDNDSRGNTNANSNTNANANSNTNANANSNSNSNTNANSNSNSNNEWWSSAYDFFKSGDDSLAYSATDSLDELITLIKVVGNMIFVAVTVMLGVKYIWGGVDAKASVKDSLITLVVAAMFFYGWDTINLLFFDGGIFFINEDLEYSAMTLYSTIIYICNFLAVGGIIYIGVRYMMAGAEGRSQLKAKGVPVVLGLIMVYGTITFLSLIVEFIKFIK